MNFEQLQSAWKLSLAMPLDPAELDRASRTASAGARAYRRGARLRLVYGTISFGLAAALLVVLVALPGPSIWPGMRAAIAIWLLSLVGCILGLWYIRHGRQPCPDTSVTTHLQAVLADIRRELAYYRALRWTFWLPFGVGFALAMLWQPPASSGHPVPLFIGGIAFVLWGFIFAPRRFAERFEPQVTRLEHILRETKLDTQTTGDAR